MTDSLRKRKTIAVNLFDNMKERIILSKDKSKKVLLNQSNQEDLELPSLIMSKPKKQALTSKRKIKMPQIQTSTYSQQSEEGQSKYTQELENIPGTLYCPKEEIETSFLNQESKFTSFFDLMDGHKNQFRNEFSFYEDCKEKSVFLRKQLNYNQNQKQNLETTITKFEQSAYGLAFQSLERNKKKITKMPQIKIYERKKQLAQAQNYQSVLQPEESEDQIPKTFRNFTFFWGQIDQDLQKQRPGPAEGSTINIVNQKMYIYGGLAKEILNEFNCFDLKEKQWQRIETTGDIPIKGRYNHTSIEYNNKLIIYGGEISFNKQLKMRSCITDLRVLNLANYSWKQVMATGDEVDPRRNHTSCLLGKKMIIYGGINNLGRYLSDGFELDLDSYTFRQLQFDSNQNQFPPIQTPAMAFHTMIPVLRYADIRFPSLYRPYEVKKNITQFPRNIQIEGIYMFGGKQNENQVISTLRILKIGVYPLEFIEPETLGQGPPVPLWHHQMQMFTSLNILILHGGRNDSNCQFLRFIIILKQVPNPVFNDIYVLDLAYLAWCKINIYGIDVQPRYSHVSAIVDDKLLIYGGQNFEMKINATIYLLELNQQIAFKKKTLFLREGTQSKYGSPKQQPQQPTFENHGIYSTEFSRLNTNKFKTFLPLPHRVFLNSQRSISTGIFLGQTNQLTKKKNLLSSIKKTVNTEQHSEDSKL